MGSYSESLSLEMAIVRQLAILEDEKEIGVRIVEDFDLFDRNVGIVLETTLKFSCHLFLAIEALNVMRKWVIAFGSRDVSAIISCQGLTLAELRVEFSNNGLEATCCLLPTNLTMVE